MSAWYIHGNYHNAVIIVVKPEDAYKIYFVQPL
jgi:hypothetical protein